MKTKGSFLVAALVPILVFSAVSVGCCPSDPRLETLKQRSRWSVDLQGWVPGEDGQISLNVRLAGPPNTTLKELTFRVNLLDANNDTLAEYWRTAHLSDVPRGAPKDKYFKVDPGDLVVEGVTLALVLNPTPEQEAQIKELQLQPASGG